MSEIGALKPMVMRINGKEVVLPEDLTRRLLDFIRIDLGLTGTKEGCQEGECGACIVFMDGKAVNSCMVPLGNAVGKDVVTIEDYSTTDEFKRIESAFLEAGAVQCGFCTPGMVMATAALLQSGTTLEENQVREGLSGNLCRCTGYQSIFEAVMKLKGGI